MIWRTIVRLILVPLAIMLAIFAALFVLFTLGQERIVQALAGGALSDDWIEGYEICSRPAGNTRACQTPSASHSNMSCSKMSMTVQRTPKIWCVSWPAFRPKSISYPSTPGPAHPMSARIGKPLRNLPKSSIKLDMQARCVPRADATSWPLVVN